MVRAILNRMASIYLYDDGREIDVPCRYVEPVVPNKFDKVDTHVTLTRTCIKYRRLGNFVIKNFLSMIFPDENWTTQKFNKQNILAKISQSTVLYHDEILESRFPLFVSLIIYSCL